MLFITLVACPAPSHEKEPRSAAKLHRLKHQLFFFLGYKKAARCSPYACYGRSTKETRSSFWRRREQLGKSSGERVPGSQPELDCVVGTYGQSGALCQCQGSNSPSSNLVDDLKIIMMMINKKNKSIILGNEKKIVLL